MALWLTWVEVVRVPIDYFIAHIGHINSVDNLEYLYYPFNIITWRRVTNGSSCASHCLRYHLHLPVSPSNNVPFYLQHKSLILDVRTGSDRGNVNLKKGNWRTHR